MSPDRRLPAPELDGALAKVGGMHRRLPFQSGPAVPATRSTPASCITWTSTCRMWRSEAWFGFLGRMDVAVVGVLGILEDGA